MPMCITDEEREGHKSVEVKAVIEPADHTPLTLVVRVRAGRVGWRDDRGSGERGERGVGGVGWGA